MREYRRKEGERNPGCQSACLLCLHFTRLLKCYFEPQTAALNPAGTTLEHALPHPPTCPPTSPPHPTPGRLRSREEQAASWITLHTRRDGQGLFPCLSPPLEATPRESATPPAPPHLFLPPSPTPGVPPAENSAAVGQKAGTRDNWSPRTLKPVSVCFLRLSILPRGSKGGVQRTTLLVLFDSLFPGKDR